MGDWAGRLMPQGRSRPIVVVFVGVVGVVVVAVIGIGGVGVGGVRWHHALASDAQLPTVVCHC